LILLPFRSCPIAGGWQAVGVVFLQYISLYTALWSLLMSRTIFITGVSSGIGHGLGTAYLKNGDRVFGVSRRVPENLGKNPRFSHLALDLTDHKLVRRKLPALFGDLKEIDICILNAATLGKFGDLVTGDMEDMQRTMQLNLWANQNILSVLYADGLELKQVVGISSGASISGNRGWGAYSLSKSALNMLIRLYAKERPGTHFAAFAPGIVDTAMQEYLCDLPHDPRFPALVVLRKKRGTSEMPDPQTAGERFLPVFDCFPELVESGAYLDIRKLPALLK